MVFWESEYVYPILVQHVFGAFWLNQLTVAWLQFSLKHMSFLILHIIGNFRYHVGLFCNLI